MQEDALCPQPPKYAGLDEALVGIAHVWQRHPGGGAERVETLIYDGERILHLLIEQGMTLDEAYEYIDFNIDGGYLGTATPIIMWPYYPQSTEDSE